MGKVLQVCIRMKLDNVCEVSSTGPGGRAVCVRRSVCACVCYTNTNFSPFELERTVLVRHTLYPKSVRQTKV